MTETPAPKASTHPIVYLALYLPYGIASGYVTVTLGWLLSHAGASVVQIAALASMTLLPNTWKVAWAPVIDTTLSAKAWFMIGLIATAASLAGIAFPPLQVSLLPVFSALVFAGSVAASVTSIAV